MNASTTHRRYWRADTQIALVRFAGTVSLLFLTCCGQTQPTDSFLGIVEPPKHPVINLIMIGILEDISDEDIMGSSPTGSRFCMMTPASQGSPPRLIPCAEPKTAAGTVMAIGQLITWFSELQAYGAATSYMTIQLAAIPEKTAKVSKARTVLFPANWTFDKRGGRKANRDTSPSGAVVTATPSLTEDPDILKIALDCRVTNIQLRKLTVAHGTLTETPRDAIPMKIELPNQAFQDLKIAFSLEYGHALILAHEIVRSRSRPAIRQHILYLAALNRSPVWPEADSSGDEPLSEPHDALTLYWPQYPGKTSLASVESLSKPTCDQVPAMGLSRAALIARLSLFEDPAITDSRLLGIALAPNCIAAFDAGGERSYVSGIMNDTSSEGIDSQTFDINTARSGISLQCAMANAEAFPDIDVSTRLASSPQISSFTREMPTPRKPLQSNIMEKFTFETCTQQVASFEQRLATTDNHIWELSLPFKTARNGASLESQNPGATTSAILYFQRPHETSDTIREAHP